jgi:hypothetical protein
MQYHVGFLLLYIETLIYTLDTEFAVCEFDYCLLSTEDILWTDTFMKSSVF